MAKKKQTAKELNTEEVAVQQQVEPVETIDPKKQILLDFKDFWDANCKGKSIAKMDVGMRIWEFWKQYTNRTDRFNGCSACVLPKINYLRSEAKKYGILIS